MSNGSLEDINAQIKQLEEQRAKLQAEVEKRRDEEKSGVVQELIERITAYGITAQDLGLSVGRSGKASKAGKAASKRKPLGSKIAGTGKTYTGPDGQTFTEGQRGRKPAWLNEQLAEGGASESSEDE